MSRGRHPDPSVVYDRWNRGLPPYAHDISKMAAEGQILLRMAPAELQTAPGRFAAQ